MQTKKDLYQAVTDRIVQALEQGTVPWVRPWKAQPGDDRPRNAVTGRPYHGINHLLLWATAIERGYQTDRWLTYRQAQEAGGHVRRGEKGTLVVFWKFVEREVLDEQGRPLLDEDGQPRRRVIPFARGYTVFNVEQCEDLPERLLPREEPPTWSPFEAAEQVVAASGATIRHRGSQAFYSPEGDFICMPPRGSFPTQDGYYATLMHELTHWTGHPRRLARKLGRVHGDADYAFEELVAELGSAFICARLGITGELRHEGYIASWLEVLKQDKRAIFRAAARAREAAEYLVGDNETEAELDSAA